MHISIVPVYMTPYQLGINWSSWMLMEGEELDVLVSAAFCCGLHWDEFQDQTMTEPKGAFHCFDWDQLLWTTLYWTSDYKTRESVS